MGSWIFFREKRCTHAARRESTYRRACSRCSGVRLPGSSGETPSSLATPATHSPIASSFACGSVRCSSAVMAASVFPAASIARTTALASPWPFRLVWSRTCWLTGGAPSFMLAFTRTAP